jgi:hypothetical protein
LLQGSGSGFYEGSYLTGGHTIGGEIIYYSGVIAYESNYGEGGRTELEIANEIYNAESYEATKGKRSGETVPFNVAINSVGDKDPWNRIGYFSESTNMDEVSEVREAFAQAMILHGCTLEEI